MAARQTLTLFVRVQILLPQPKTGHRICGVRFLFRSKEKDLNGSVVNSCRWHEEPTLTEPAGENKSFFRSQKWGCRKCLKEAKVRQPLYFQFSFSRDFYQITTRLDGAIYILSVFLTPKVVYHSSKLRGCIFARSTVGACTSTACS